MHTLKQTIRVLDQVLRRRDDATGPLFKKLLKQKIHNRLLLL